MRTEEQLELGRIVRSLLDKHADGVAVRRAAESEAGYDESLWRTLCEQVGVAALPVPDEEGGAGASLVETAVVLEELGRSLAPSPLLASALCVADARLHDGDLADLAAGAVRPFSLGGLVLEPAERTPTMDATIRLGTGGDDLPHDLPDDLRDVAAALVSALQVGAMQRGLEMTVGYSKEREQFGRPIGSFQALKHRMADMLVLVEASRSASWAATAAAAAYVEAPDPDNRATLARLSAVARAYCTDALAHVASETVQLHGGIAITWEHDAQLLFKRAHALNHLLEPAHTARARVLPHR